jgi:hypothetical protein
MKLTLSDTVKILEGMVLVNLEFASPGDDRASCYGQRIKKTYIGTDEVCEDAGVWLTLENDNDVFVYANEEITYGKE